MSEAKEQFYEILVPKIELFGFEFKKSKTSFVKTENGLEYQIHFQWDGRGGITMLDSVYVYVNDLAIQQTIKKQKQTKRNGLPHLMSGWGYRDANKVEIPVMYSKATLDLANNMNFKGLSQMPQDDKYPPDRILHSAKFVEDLIIKQVLPFFDAFKNKANIYDYLRKKAENEPDTINFTDDIKNIFREYAAALGLPEIPQLST